MAQQQAGALPGSEQPGVPTTQPAQMDASQSRTSRTSPQAAFGSGDGAALVFRDYASI